MNDYHIATKLNNLKFVSFPRDIFIIFKSKILFKMKTKNQKHKKIKLSFNQIFKSIRDKIFKITSFKVKENKALNETEFIIRGETKMTDGIVKKGKAKTKKVPELHPELKQFI